MGQILFFWFYSLFEKMWRFTTSFLWFLFPAKDFSHFRSQKINILLFPYGKVIRLANFLLETRITNQTFTNSFGYCCFNTLKAALLTYVTSPIQKEITKIFALFILNFLGYEKYKSFDVTKLIFVLPTFRLIQQSLSRITC